MKEDVEIYPAIFAEISYDNEQCVDQAILTLANMLEGREWSAWNKDCGHYSLKIKKVEI